MYMIVLHFKIIFGKSEQILASISSDLRSYTVLQFKGFLIVHVK